MEAELVLLDTSILIDFYRKTDKSKSLFFKLANENKIFGVSVITHFEIYSGSKPDQISFWDNLFHDFAILPLNKEISFLATNIDAALKKKRMQIDIPDLLIAATAVTHGLPCATLNKKHFGRIDGLKLI